MKGHKPPFKKSGWSPKLRSNTTSWLVTKMQEEVCLLEAEVCIGFAEKSYQGRHSHLDRGFQTFVGGRQKRGKRVIGILLFANTANAT